MKCSEECYNVRPCGLERIMSICGFKYFESIHTLISPIMFYEVNRLKPARISSFVEIFVAEIRASSLLIRETG